MLHLAFGINLGQEIIHGVTIDSSVTIAFVEVVVCVEI